MNAESLDWRIIGVKVKVTEKPWTYVEWTMEDGKICRGSDQTSWDVHGQAGGWREDEARAKTPEE